MLAQYDFRMNGVNRPMILSKVKLPWRSWKLVIAIEAAGSSRKAAAKRKNGRTPTQAHEKWRARERTPERSPVSTWASCDTVVCSAAACCVAPITRYATRNVQYDLLDIRADDLIP